MEKKNTGLIITIVVLSLIIGGLGGFIVYDKVLNNEKNVEETNKEEIQNDYKNETVISQETIKELAKDKSLNINTDFSNTDIIASSTNNNESLYLSVDENDKLIIKYNEKHSLVQNIDENIVMFSDNVGGCQIGSLTHLILTNKGNIYSFSDSDIINDINSENSKILDNINNSNPVTLPLTKVNGDTKILAFTNIANTLNEEAEDPITCGEPAPIVYTENDELMKIIIEYNNIEMKLYEK